MASLDCNMVGVSSASSSHIAIRSITAKIQLPVCKILLLGARTLKCRPQIDFKGTHHNGKDLLTNRKDPWAESKDIKGPKKCHNTFWPLKCTTIPCLVARFLTSGNMEQLLFEDLTPRCLFVSLLNV